MSSISINILNYNTYDKSKVCIESCLKQLGVNFRILLIDNSSTDNSFELLKSEYGDRIDYLQNGYNYGFAKGNNLGVNYAASHKYKYSLLLNSDTELIGERLVEKLVSTMENNPGCAVVVPDIYDVTSNGLQPHNNDSFYLKLLRYFNVLPNNKIISKNLSSISEAHGSALLVDNDRFIEVGGFPEHYFMYGEESTFSKKILWRGYSLLWLHTGINYILHHHDKTTNVDSWRLFLMGRNRGLEFYQNRDRFNIWSIPYYLFFAKLLLTNTKNNAHYLKGLKDSRNLFSQHKSSEYIFKEGKNCKDNYS